MRWLAEKLMEEFRISQRRACKVVQTHRSGFHYKSTKRDESVIRKRMREIAQVRVRYGFERIFILLRREGFKDNHKRVYRLYKAEELNLRSKRPKRNKAAAHRMERLHINKPNKSWSMDFVADQLFNGKKFRALTVIDNFTRKCLAIIIGQSLRGNEVVSAMEQIKASREMLPERIQVDNGSEFISKVLDKWAYENNFILDFSRPGKPTDNPFIESFNGSFRDECLNVNWFLSMDDAQDKIEAWRNEYNSFRPHSSINNSSPDEFELYLKQNKPEISTSGWP